MRKSTATFGKERGKLKGNDVKWDVEQGMGEVWGLCEAGMLIVEALYKTKECGQYWCAPPCQRGAAEKTAKNVFYPL